MSKFFKDLVAKINASFQSVWNTTKSFFTNWWEDQSNTVLGGISFIHEFSVWYGLAGALILAVTLCIALAAVNHWALAALVSWLYFNLMWIFLYLRTMVICSALLIVCSLIYYSTIQFVVWCLSSKQGSWYKREDALSFPYDPRFIVINA